MFLLLRSPFDSSRFFSIEPCASAKTWSTAYITPKLLHGRFPIKLRISSFNNFLVFFGIVWAVADVCACVHLIM